MLFWPSVVRYEWFLNQKAKTTRFLNFPSSAPDFGLFTYLTNKWLLASMSIHMIDEVGLCPKGLVAIFALERPRAFVNQSMPLKPSINNPSSEGEGGLMKGDWQ